MADGGFEENQSGVGTQKGLVEREARLAGFTGPDRVVRFLEFLKEKGKIDSKIKKFSTGFDQLDFFVDSVETGELVVITGPTGNGKTLFAESLTRNLLNQNVPVAWFSYEVPTLKMLEKYTGLGDVPLFVPMELKAGNFDWIVDRCYEAKLKYDCRIVFIDHLHYVVDMGTKLNMSLNIGGVLRQMKNAIAIGMNMSVVLICHQEKLETGGEPSLDRTRDSSFIGQEADIGIVVYRTPDTAVSKGAAHSYEEGWATVKVDKARRVGTFRKKITYQKDGHWLREF